MIAELLPFGCNRQTLQCNAGSRKGFLAQGRKGAEVDAACEREGREKKKGMALRL